MDQKTEITQALMSEFYQIVEDRYPSEACGVLIPTPYRGRRIWEMPNRSLRPHDKFQMDSEDVRLSIGEWIGENPELLSEVTFWHSHPSGDSDPSEMDVEHKIIGARNLVIAINKKKQINLTWY